MKLTTHPAAPATTSAARTSPVRVSPPHQSAPRPAPSLGMPVTRHNRRRLRALRAAESRAWNAVPVTATLHTVARTTLAGQRAESRLMLGVSALAAVALVLAIGASLDFVAYRNYFEMLIRRLLS